jgi:hypothetical protein
VRRDGDKSGSLVFSEPKNASRRTVGLPARAVRALQEHRRRQMEEKIKAGSGWQDNGLVFTNSKGKPLEAQNVVNRSFKPLSFCVFRVSSRVSLFAGPAASTPRTLPQHSQTSKVESFNRMQ